MDAFIALTLVGTIFLHVGLYARSAYLRRHIMLPRVMDYLRREDVSPLQKKVAQEAFQDALSVRMPLGIKKTVVRRVRNKTPDNVVTTQDNLIDHMADETPANIELMKIIQIMFWINFRFNFLLYLLVGLLRFRFRASIRSKSAEVSRAYADIKIQHQN